MAFVVNIASVAAPILFCVLAGFALAKLDLPFDRPVVTSLVSNIGVPGLVISHLAAQHVAFGAFLDVMLGALTVLVCFALIASVFLHLNRLSLRTFLSPMMLGNAGNIGLPVTFLAFGNEGLAYAMAFWVVVVIAVFTIGMWIPQGKITMKALLRSPAIYSVAVDMILLGTNTQLPKPIHQTLDLLGGLTIPLMLLTLGHTLAELKPAHLVRGIYLATFHLLMAIAVAFSLVEVFQFQGTARGVFMLQCLMPISVFSYLWAEKYDSEHAPQVASVVLCSTLMSIVALPLALSYWM